MKTYKYSLGQHVEAAKRAIQRIHSDPWCQRDNGGQRGTDVAFIRSLLQRLEDTKVLEEHIDDR